MRQFVMLLIAAISLTACQKKADNRLDLKVGRGARGGFNKTYTANQSAAAGGQCGRYQKAGKTWGEVIGTQGQEAFWNELYYLTYPVLKNLGEDDQLGYVAAQSNQSTGVRFWGTAIPYSGTVGEINPETAEIRIEIYDDRACEIMSDGTQRAMVPIHISKAVSGSAFAFKGTISGGQVSLTFQDAYGAISMNGQIQGSIFTGTMSYYTSSSNGVRTLGRFNVAASSFFR